jgi:hypothetical protein
MLTDALTKALCEVKFAQFVMSILLQEAGLDQTAKVEDQASAPLVVKQAHAIRKQGQGSVVLASKR